MDSKRLKDIYNELKEKRQSFGDCSEDYTSGYIAGRLNGQIELLEEILGIKPEILLVLDQEKNGICLGK